MHKNGIPYQTICLSTKRTVEEIVDVRKCKEKKGQYQTHICHKGLVKLYRIFLCVCPNKCRRVTVAVLLLQVCYRISSHRTGDVAACTGKTKHCCHRDTEESVKLNLPPPAGVMSTDCYFQLNLPVLKANIGSETQTGQLSNLFRYFFKT